MGEVNHTNECVTDLFSFVYVEWIVLWPTDATTLLFLKGIIYLKLFSVRIFKNYINLKTPRNYCELFSYFCKWWRTCSTTCLNNFFFRHITISIKCEFINRIWGTIYCDIINKIFRKYCFSLACNLVNNLSFPFHVQC